ncbi:hypothetical protein [Mycobacterium sp. 852002-51057_SCH5723018]|uniref:hypothetical protein n=1 Tax=Mycobacterium sp. 852002-51057_SCH5723018 TaxID=1834094 RepID=UPI0008006AF3|nr:hypothetical protein [Mycobacterium sp. 852002-51057_SCH5723018]OBG28051.1 hypothetical protein A5764_26445 [Mycobacterium sp. 852002-51057_SCH5723018]
MASVGALEVVDDLRAARWLAEHIRTFAVDVGSLVPAVFAAYARVLHPARDGGESVRWAQIARANRRTVHPEMQFTRLIGYRSRYSPGYPAKQSGVFDEAPEVGTLPPDVAAWLARTLARHTATAGQCWFAVWDGHGCLDEAFQSRPTFQLPNRNYHLARGPVAAAAQSLGTTPGRHLSSNLWWPDDQSWCVATDIDLDSTYVGGSEACIEEIIANSQLEAMPLGATAGITADSDILNPAFAPDGF